MRRLLYLLVIIPLICNGQIESSQEKTLNSHSGDLRFLTKGIEMKFQNRYDSIYSESFTQVKNKSVTQINLLLDSGYTYGFTSPTDSFLVGKLYYLYDSKGNPIISIYLTLEKGTNQIFFGLKDTFTYDVNGKLTLDITYDWELNQWISYSKHAATYDSNGKITQESWYGWDKPTNTWLGSYKDENTYDVNGNKTLGIRYVWDIATNQWISFFKDEISYNPNGKIISDVRSNWNNANTQWADGAKDTFIYNGNGNLLQDIYYIWNDINSNFDNSEKYEYIYDTTGNNTLSIRYDWNNTSSQWLNGVKDTFAYDKYGNQTMDINSDWGTNQWYGAFKLESAFDSIGNKTSVTRYNYFDIINNQWIGYSKIEYSYDASGNLILLIGYGFDTSTHQWKLSQKNEYYFSVHNLSYISNPTNFKSVKLYPNPVHDEFKLEIDDNSIAHYQLYNSVGQLIKTSPVNKGITIDNISNLKSGIYIIQLSGKNGTIIIKFVKN